MTEAYDFSLIPAYFYISPEGAGQPLAEMPATGLANDETRLEELLRLAGEQVRAFDLTLPGSFIGMTLCQLCVTKWLFLARYGVILDLSLERLTFQIEADERHGHPHLGFRIDEVVARPVPEEDGDAEVVRDWEAFVAGSVAPAVETIARVAGMKPEMIWHQFGSYVPLVRDYAKQKQLPEEAMARLDHHIALLTESVPPETFRQRRHPFVSRIRYVENFYQPGQCWAIKSACCLYDRREGGEKCYLCPRRTDAERAEMKRRALATANSK